MKLLSMLTVFTFIAFFRNFTTAAAISQELLLQLKELRLSADGLETLQFAPLACVILGRALPSIDVVTRNSSSYESLNHVNFDHSAWTSPQCILTPRTASEVSLALKIVKFTNAPFAIRSGGHSPHLGWANIQDGVLFAMSGLNGVTYDKVTKTAVVGSGNRWGDVYQSLEKYGVTAVGGRVPEIGVGGLLLGGGLSHISNEYGLACDNVINYEVVLADLRVINVNAKENADLFWALKGGTNNFGIVTRFTLKTYPVSKVWGGLYVYDFSHGHEVVAAMATYQSHGQSDLKSALSIQFLPNNGTVILTVLYSEPVNERPAAFEPFYNIPALQSTVRVKSWVEFHKEVLAADITRWDFETTSILLDKSLYNDVLDIAIETSQNLVKAHVQGATLVVVGQPISRSMIEAGHANGGNALGLTNKPQWWVNFALGWSRPTDDTAAVRISSEGIQKIAALARSRRLADDYMFMNDAGKDQKVLQSYGHGRNLERLRAVAAKYDRESIFQRLVKGGYKLY